VAEVERLRVADREVLRLSSEQLRLDVVPSVGGTALSLVRLEDETELLWSSPWGLRPPSAHSLPGGQESHLYDSLAGGWQSIFPNGGDAAVVDGAEWGFDGEVRLAWFDWEVAGSSVIMKSRLLRSPFTITKILSVIGDEVTIGETVTNIGERHVDVVWGAQVFLGSALLEPGSVLDATASIVRPDPRHAAADYEDILPWPRSYDPNGMINLRTLPPPESRVTRAAYLSDFLPSSASGGALVTVTNEQRRLRVGFSWDLDALPHLWYRLEAGGTSGYPWYGAAHFLSLTPSTSWPARGLPEVRRISATSLRIHPGVARTAHLSVRVTSSR
jgi:hypothetical protein